MTAQDGFVGALCVWREARNSPEGMQAVAWVLVNRLATGRWGTTMLDVATARLQFSSMTDLGDFETILWPNSHCSPGDLAAWATALDCMAIATVGAVPDPTSGATFYFAESIAKPSWADSMMLTATIGGQEFYREAA